MSKTAYLLFGEEMLEKDAKIEQLEQELSEQTSTLDQLAKRIAQLESIIRASGGTVPG